MPARLMPWRPSGWDCCPSQSKTTRGSFNLGTALQRILVPDDADQIAVYEFTLDPQASMTGAPADLFLELSTGQAEIGPSVPAGWTATEFDIWAFAENLGTSLPIKDADGDAMDLRTVYALAVNAVGPVNVTMSGATHSEWSTGPIGSGDTVSTRDMVMVDPAGWPITADQQIKIINQHTAANTITIAVLGKRQ